ncbi:MAG: hypothetical protein PHH77_10860 [Victivallaceae bacterium]|nr:hypothetical protein [Victivallaceae bacterium]
MNRKKRSNKKRRKGMTGTQSSCPPNPQFYKMREVMREASAQKFMSLCATCHRICYGNKPMPPERELETRNKICSLAVVAWNITSDSDTLDESLKRGREAVNKDLSPAEQEAVFGMIAQLMKLKWTYCRDVGEYIDDAEIQRGTNDSLNLAIAWHEPLPPLTKQETS